MKIYYILLLFLSNLSMGVVLHPEGEPTPLWVGRPVDSATAKVGSCSGVVIHPNYVLTAKHCSYGLSTPIKIKGDIYYGEKFYDQHHFDLRLIKINHEFEDFAAVPIFEIPDFFEGIDIECVVGGYGRTRGATQYASYNPNLVVGYAWSGSSGNLTWGTNKIYGYSKAGIYIKFNSPLSTPFECGVALYDSGCGLFAMHEGEWKTIGIARSVNDYGFDYFYHPTQDKEYSTMNNFTRVDAFSGWINSIIYGADMNADGEVDLIDMAIFSEDWLAVDNPDFPFIKDYYSLYKSRSDLNQDGKINMIDFVIFSKEWKR